MWLWSTTWCAKWLALSDHSPGSKKARTDMNPIEQALTPFIGFLLAWIAGFMSSSFRATGHAILDGDEITVRRNRPG